MTEQRWLEHTSRPLVDEYDLALLDLDGVVYLMGDLIPGAADAVAAFRENGVVRFITNNASRSAQQVADLMTTRGLRADASEVRTSAQALAAALHARYGDGATILVVGAPALAAEITRLGLTAIAPGDDGPPVAVAQGIAPDIAWRDIADVTATVREGAWWAVTNRDTTIPSPRGLLPGNGTLVAAVAEALGRQPDLVAGKPSPVMFAQTIAEHPGARPIAVGDRHDTDLAAARAVGVPSLLVFSGTTSPADVPHLPVDARPDYIGWSLSSLTETHPEVRRVDAVWRCRRWRGDASPGRITLSAAPGGPDLDDLDALRVVTAATWAARDEHGTTPEVVAGDEPARAALDRLQIAGA